MEEIKKDPELGEIPVIMFTAVNQNETIAAAYDAGVNEYITKPIHPNELKQRIREWLDKDKK